jgi:hypothetical protein
MSNAITLQTIKSEARVDSRVIAEQLGNQHEAIFKLIVAYREDFEGFGGFPILKGLMPAEMTPAFQKSLRWSVVAVYSVTVPEKSGAGFSIPYSMRAQALARRAFFVSTVLWWAVWSYLRVGRPHAGNANSVQPATLLISISGGGSQYKHEGSIMSNSNRNTLAHSAHPNHAQPAHFQFNETKARERISANIALLSCACADQALHVELVSESPSAVAELSEISRRLDSISTEIVEGQNER